MINAAIIDYTAKKAENFFIKFTAPGHGWPHVALVWNFAKEIAKREKVEGKILEMAALLHDIGRVTEYNHNPKHLTHHESSFELALEWFKKDRNFFVLSEKEKEEILYAIKNHWDDTAVKYPSAMMLRDADKLDLYGNHGIERGKEFHGKNWQGLIFGLAANFNRARRLVTKAARDILKEKKILAPYQNSLARFLPKKKKVLCAMSGGVDSSVAAKMLLEAGFEVTGAFIKCFSDEAGSKSCWIDERRDALRVAAKLGIKLLTFDFEKEYRRDVISYLFREYKAGRTPNPDVVCNKYVKIPLLLQQAKKSGYDWVATGHYARIKNGEKGEIFLCEAVDKNKDQSYFLHQLGRKELKKLIFPLGTINKSEVRIFARDWGLSVAEKEESMGICFVGEVPMKKFLSKKIKFKKGKIVMSTGEVVGEHDGLAFYTIGQRHGMSLVAPHHTILRVSQDTVLRATCLLKLSRRRKRGNLIKGETKPLYVVGKDIKKNLLIVGFEDDKLLFKKEIILPKIHWTLGAPPKLPLECEARLRHRQPLQECKIFFSGGKYKIKFKKAQRAVTPGQFIVFYLKGRCLGGGEIS